VTLDTDALKTDRRRLIAGAAALAATPGAVRAAGTAAMAFPKGFVWGAATAGHQIEGNNVNSDSWVLENVTPSIYRQPSGDACNSLELWAQDLDAAAAMGLNAYRFSLEWPRIEPERGQFSMAMLDHYKRIIEGCRARGLTPVVTFNHYTTPRWFAREGGWVNPQAPGLFARFCETAAKHLAAQIGYATTLNEPNIMNVLKVVLPPPVVAAQRAMLQAAAKACGSDRFAAGNSIDSDDVDAATVNLIAGHKAARAAIKGVRPDLPVGLSLSMFDDVGDPAVRDRMRGVLYGAWLDAVRGDDFLGVQNYEQVVWRADGTRAPARPGLPVNYAGAEVCPPSLAGAVRYAHAATGCPIIVTEHGVGTDDDSIRAGFIPASLGHLRQAMADGVPVQGYVHWSLIDNFEWIFGYKVHLGLHSIEPGTFRRIPKPSAAVLGRIARANALA